jgi:hypothetical protein
MKSKKKPKANLCAYCYGEGLSKTCAAYGWRVPIGEGLGRGEKTAIPCDRCGKMGRG